MNLEEYKYDNSQKNHILTWLPVMKELERMGYNPVKLLFTKIELSMKEIEDSYVALSTCKERYPEWYKIVSSYVDNILHRKFENS